MKLLLAGLGDYVQLPAGIRQLPITTLASGATQARISYSAGNTSVPFGFPGFVMAEWSSLAE